MKEKLFISVRDDGVATRLLSILNAMYLADKFYDIRNMRFFWNDEIVLFGNYYINNNSRKFENCNIIGQSVGKVESIFSSNFIKKHYLENKYLYTTNMAYDKNASYPSHTLDLLRMGFNKNYAYLLEQVLNNKYIYVHQHDLSLQFHGIESNNQYKNKLKEMWSYIDFNQCLKQQILNANQKSNNLDKFIIVHVRSGDIIYNYSNARKFNLEGVYHATPLELAAAIIAKNKYDNIVIVGDDLTSTQMLKDIFKSNRVFHISDFRDDNLSNLELLIFDVVFMSNSSKIYGTYSALVLLSSIIGKNKILQNNY
ncbi:sugar transferase, partial [Campylobacter jejuni]|nr:sugar transferase [Campylobacter jejuni]